VAAVVVILAVGALAFAALSGGGGSPRAGPPSSPGSSDTSGSTSPPSTPAPDAAAMQTFVTTYLSTVTQDEHASWAMLTPAYQRASGGFGSYQRFWGSIDTATASGIRADPANLTVSYDVAYVRTDGDRTTEHHTLQLVRDHSSYLIENQLS
jgi:hypothetical protein